MTDRESLGLASSKALAELIEKGRMPAYFHHCDWEEMTLEQKQRAARDAGRLSEHFLEDTRRELAERGPGDLDTGLAAIDDDEFHDYLGGTPAG